MESKTFFSGLTRLRVLPTFGPDDNKISIDKPSPRRGSRRCSMVARRRRRTGRNKQIATIFK